MCVDSNLWDGICLCLGGNDIVSGWLFSQLYAQPTRPARGSDLSLLQKIGGVGYVDVFRERKYRLSSHVCGICE